MLRQWARHGGLSQNQLQLVHEWLNNPDGFATRNKISRQTAKEGILGPVAYRTAMERHQRLNKKEWLVAYFTAAGMRQQEIARLTRRSPRTVDNIIRDIKDKITQELEADIESVELTQIARWFFGL